METFFINALAAYVDSRTSLVAGNNLIVSEVPRDTDGVYLIASPSPEPEKYSPIRRSIVDFWARYRDSYTAYVKLREIYDALDRMYQYEIGDAENPNKFEVYFSFSLGQVEDQDRDNEGGKLVKLSMEFIYRDVDTIS